MTTETKSVEARLEGRVKFANSRGFGFIETAQKIDFYFHYSQFKDDWKKLLVRFVKNEDIQVTFLIDDTATDGPRAKDVRIK
jgi:cold shock CspA family protein